MGKICSEYRYFGAYVYHYSVYGGQQQYDVSFNDFEGLFHAPNGVTGDSNSTELSSSKTVFECRQYGISSVRYVPIQMKPIVGTNLLNCDNEVGILSFVSYSRIGSICLQKGCSIDSCRIDCDTAPDGFCCIDHSFTDRLLQVLQN